MNERMERGRAILRATVGEDYYAQRVETTTDFNRPIRDLTDEYCFGEVWAGDALPPKLRSLLVVTLLTAMGRVPELKTHIRGAINNGCSVAEIQAALLQVAIYCGIPAGVEGFRTAEQTLSELGKI